ncbi:MAG: PGPGW domain-containing protein [Microthrixaceae bacterium]|nr:PGPGW domain-containing protein [Microthrixaceae bacterium]
MDPHESKQHDHALHMHEAARQVHEAALEAERATGRHEETIEEAERSLALRVARALGGFALVGIGIALLPLPGPGWVAIIIGLSLLPFSWAERTIGLIRRRIPGIPEDGAIPVHTWIIMGLIVAATTTVSILFGKQIGNWTAEVWSNLWS